AVTWAAGRLERRTLADYGLPFPWRRLRQFGLGVCGGLVGLSVLMMALIAVGAARFEGLALHGVQIFLWAGVFALLFLLVGTFEEVRSRGYVQATLARGMGFWPASLVTSALFATTHVSNQGESILGVANAGAFAFVLCLVLRRTGNLWPLIGA